MYNIGLVVELIYQKAGASKFKYCNSKLNVNV